ncbi:sensor histidine kinase [Propionicicella superfundia]|uniref:sensor histidine kinase n=1 Tax=Propionicicella superfundia TaxID=348582 RepID=UPI0003F87334|nr:histidine kinase [Propionicicella superfundia]
MSGGQTGHGDAAEALHRPHSILPAWLGDVVAAVLIVSAAFVPFPGDELRPGRWEATVLVIAPAAVLPLRRRRPVPVLAACLVLYGSSSLAGTLSPGAALAVAIAMFGVANRSTRRATVIIGGVAVTVVFLLSMPAALGNLLDPRAFQFVLAVAFAAAAGDGARSRRAYVEAITERAERAERTRESEARRRVTEERLRIARDLHDTVAHQIAVISLNAGVASSALDSNPDRARAALGTIRQAARTVLGEIGDLLSMLRADDPQTAAVPQYGLEHVDTLLEQFRASGLDVRMRVEGDLGQVTGTVGHVAYRTIQEALTNAHKHGAGHQAHLLLCVAGDTVRIVVSNPVADGGATAEHTARPGASGAGVGLVGLRERIASVRGTVQAGSAPGGWKVAATIPLSKERR